MLVKIDLPACGEKNVKLVSQTVNIEDIEVCPICGKTISPKFIHGHFTHTAKSLSLLDIVINSFVNVMFECTSCRNAILGKYKVNYELRPPNSYDHLPTISSWKSFNLISFAPVQTKTFPYAKIISDVSPKFAEIYTQSIQAKAEGKNELVGIGYRKAIEFLIKDYLIFTNHEKKETVPNMHLGDCIKLIDQPKIQTLAKASTWLGNDETHYVRKHTDKDLNDLERFINSMVQIITFELTADDALSFINK